MNPSARVVFGGLAVALTVFAFVLAGYVAARAPRDLIPRDGGVGVAAASGSPVAYTVKKDTNATSIGEDLARLGVIRSGKQFKLLVSLMGVEGKLSAGEYEFGRGSSATYVSDLVTVKQGGATQKVTFREGIRFEEMADIAEKAGFGTRQQFLDAVKNARVPAEIAASLPAGASLQGYLFPDTYIMPQGATAAQLVDLMLKTFLDRFGPDLRAAATARGLTLHQAVTLASIVEREAALASERPMIAAVFENRLAAKDLLGADPTVQYALTADPNSVAQFGWWKAEITADDLKIPSPYNTRLYPGLPPGPIASPGLASLEAVVRPADTKAYYFVANAKANDGSHVFAETAEEHDRNIAQFGTP